MILLAAAVPAWRVRHLIPTSSLGSLLPTMGWLLPAVSVASPEAPETGPAPGPVKPETHQAEAVPHARPSASAAVTAGDRINRTSGEATPSVPVPIIEPTPAADLVAATPSAAAAAISALVEQSARNEAAFDTDTKSVSLEPLPARSSLSVSVSDSKAVSTRASNAVSTSTSHVYGDADANVTPPEVIGGKKELGGIVGAIEPGTTVTIEFVVNELGLVESAKGLREPRTVGESLLLATGLHSIKSWRFRPAQKDGEPVSYRKSMSFGAY